MKKLYQEFFYIPKYGKIREKVMVTRVTMTVAVIVFCLVAMGLTAYAYFSSDVTSGSNMIKAAYFEAQITITGSDQNGEPVKVDPSSTDGKKTVFTFANTGTYTVELEKGNHSTAKTGFCIITINGTDYFTQQIGNDVERGLTDGSASVVFTLKVSSATKIEILSHWGTSKYYGYTDDGRPELFIDSTGFSLDLANDEGGKSEDNTQQSEETATTPPTDTTTSTTGTEPSAPTPETTTPVETTPPATETTPPATETTKPEETSPPETSEPIYSTEPSSPSEPATSTESTDSSATTETQPETETSGTPTTEASE